MGKFMESLHESGITRVMKLKAVGAENQKVDLAEISGYVRQLNMACERVQKAIDRAKRTGKAADIVAVGNEFRAARNVCDSGYEQSIRTKETISNVS